MDEQKKKRLRLLKKMREDLSLFGQRALKIKSKDMSIVPFQMNEPQQYVHEQLEKQLAETGKVRALILKARQQGMCLPPETLVKTNDYRWVRIDSLAVGDSLLGFDENAPKQRGDARRMRTAVVEHVARRKEPCLRLTFASGHTFMLSTKHRMLMQQRGGTYTQWRAAEDMRVGDKMRRVLHAPARPPKDSAWAGGLLDADGSVGGKMPRVSLTQVSGAILERYRSFLIELGVNFYETVDRRTKAGLHTKLGDRPVHCLRVDKFADIVKLFSVADMCKARDVHEGRKLPTSGTGFTAWDTITAIESVGTLDVVDLQTSTKTFIAEGYASHNSTYVAARFYQKSSLYKGRNVFIMAHAQDSSDALFKIVDRYHINNPFAPHTAVSNVKELEFDRLDSSYAVGTAGQKAGGRGRTPTLFHGSEVSHWNNAKDHFAASVQGVPGSPGTEIILESTANGPAGEFYERWQDAMAGRSDYIAIFVPWFWSKEYRRDDLVDETFELDDTAEEGDLSEREYAEMFDLDHAQMAWRRRKIAELRDPRLFKQEYPATAEEAFQTAGNESFIAPAHVLRARKRPNNPAGPLIFGVDPAGPGGDRFAVYARRGYGYDFLKWRDKIEAPEANQWLKSMIDKHDPAVVFIDAGGIGAATISLLRAEGPKYAERVKAVNFGGTSQHKLAKPKVPGPKNRRAEMWQRAKDYLMDDVGVSIPDLDALQADLTAPGVKDSTTNDLLLESKRDMKKRGLRSPDLADSFVLTFADLRHIDSYSDKRKRPSSVVENPDAPAVQEIYGDMGDADGWMA